MSDFNESAFLISDDESEDDISSKGSSHGSTINANKLLLDGSRRSRIRLPCSSLKKGIIIVDSEESESEEARCLSPSTRLSITGIKQVERSSNENDSIPFKYQSAGKHESTPQAKKKLKERPFKDSEAVDEDAGSEKSQNSPLHLLRYSSHFKTDINDNLSSTMFQKSFQNAESSKDLTDADKTSSFTVSSDVAIMDHKEMPIVLSSSSGDETGKPESSCASSIDSETIQPKLTTIVKKMSSTGAIPKQQSLNYVSRDYFNKEMKKLEELISEKAFHNSLGSCPAANVLADDPKGLKIALMPHQKHALAWMYWREKQKRKGRILADDMGLGKTLTIISLVLACKNDEGSEARNDDSDTDGENSNPKWSSKGRRDNYQGGTFVRCPASLLRQWEFEIEIKVSRNKLTTCVHHGQKRDSKPTHLCTYDIIITTYTIVSREQKVGGALFGIEWKRIILDEAHTIRNHKSQTSETVCPLR
uniref:Helicase ATP-binding domain-containing protein n=1 Tax=Glossina pallidipes TaxID=7398 RepID=A0A1A9ZBX5_GLOPL